MSIEQDLRDDMRLLERQLEEAEQRAGKLESKLEEEQAKINEVLEYLYLDDLSSGEGPSRSKIEDILGEKR